MISQMKAELHVDLVLCLLSQQHDDGQRRENEVRLTTMHSKEGERVTFTFQTRLKRAVVLTSLEGLDLTPLVSPMVSILKKKISLMITRYFPKC